MTIFRAMNAYLYQGFSRKEIKCRFFWELHKVSSFLVQFLWHPSQSCVIIKLVVTGVQIVNKWTSTLTLIWLTTDIFDNYNRTELPVSIISKKQPTFNYEATLGHMNCIFHPIHLEWVLIWYPLAFSLYLRHSFYSDTGDFVGNRVKMSHFLLFTIL